MIRVTLEFQTTEELVNFFAQPQIIPNTAEQPTANPTVAPEAKANEAVSAAPAKRGRPKKIESAEGQQASPPSEPVAPSPAPVEPSAEPAPTASDASIDDVRKYAQQVIEKLGNNLGMNEARKVLEAKAGVRKISDLDPAKAGAVVEGLKAILAQK